MKTIELAERGWLPEGAIRWGIRRKLARRLQNERRNGTSEGLGPFLAKLKASPVALATDVANAQHYELPPAYFDLVLGPRRKYSGCYWPEGITGLAEAEQAMLELYAQRAKLADGQRVLELGCGWGSFCLWAAERYPGSRIVAVSNSRTQRAYIEERARAGRLKNLEVITADVNHLQLEGPFERVVSIEMFEHLRNYEEVMGRIAGWLAPEGQLFVHIFTHRKYAYLFEDDDAGQDWMSRYFFAGGTMPSDDLLPQFQEDLRLKRGTGG